MRPLLLHQNAGTRCVLESLNDVFSPDIVVTPLHDLQTAWSLLQRNERVAGYMQGKYSCHDHVFCNDRSFVEGPLAKERTGR